MLISQIGKILSTIDRWFEGNSQLSEVAQALEMPLNNLVLLLSWNNFVDGNNRAHPWITRQDIVNIITLYFAMKPTHKFTFTVYGGPDDGYAKMDETRITIQPLKQPHPTRQGGRKPPG